MIKTEIAAVLCLALLALGGLGAWYEHHTGFKAGVTAQRAADQHARAADRAHQRQLADKIAALRAASRASAARAERELDMARGPCVHRAMPAAVVRGLHDAGVRTAASEKKPNT